MNKILKYTWIALTLYALGLLCVISATALMAFHSKHIVICLLLFIGSVICALAGDRFIKLSRAMKI